MNLEINSILNRNFNFGFSKFLYDEHHKKVDVNSSLYDPRSHGDDVVEALVVISVDPIHDVEKFVRSKSGEIEKYHSVYVRCFSLICDSQLGKNGDTFKVN